MRDILYAWRGLRRNPGFAAATMATLALGIGAATAVFSVVYGMLLRPLAIPNADRIVQIVQILSSAPGPKAEAIRAGLAPD